MCKINGACPYLSGNELHDMTDEAHHSTEQDLIQNRIDKAERIRARGGEPYKYTFERSCTVGETWAAFEQGTAAES